MLVKKVLSGLAVAATLAFGSQAFAQAELVDTTAVSVACSTSAVDCRLAVQAAIASLRAAGVTPAALNAAIGVIAGTALGASSSMPVGERSGVADIMAELAAVSTDGTQQASLNDLARSLRNGPDVNLEAQAAAVVGGGGGGGGGGGDNAPVSLN